jgi:hypothetical protein
MVRKLYMNADQGDITLDSPDAFLLKTSGLAAVAILTPLFLVGRDLLVGGAHTPGHPDVIW